MKDKNQSLKEPEILDCVEMFEPAKDIIPDKIRECFRIRAHNIPRNWDYYLERKANSDFCDLLKDNRNILIVGNRRVGKTLLGLREIYRLDTDYYVLIPIKERLVELCKLDFQKLLADKRIILFLDDVNHYVSSYPQDYISYLYERIGKYATEIIFIGTIRKDRFINSTRIKSCRLIEGVTRIFEIKRWNYKEGEGLAKKLNKSLPKSAFDGTPDSIVSSVSPQAAYELIDEKSARDLLFCFTLLYEISIQSINSGRLKDFFIELYDKQYKDNDYHEALIVLESNNFLKISGEEITYAYEPFLEIKQHNEHLKSHYLERLIRILLAKRFFKEIAGYIYSLSEDVERYQDVCRIGEQLLKEDSIAPEMKAHVLVSLCHAYRRIGDITLAKEKIAVGIDFCKDKFSDIVYTFWDEMGLVYLYEWQLPKSLACSEKALKGLMELEKKPFENFGLSQRIARSYENLILAYLYNGKIEQAQYCCEKRQEYLEKLYDGNNSIPRYPRAKLTRAYCWLSLAKRNKTKQDYSDLQSLINKAEAEYKGNSGEYSYKLGVGVSHLLRGLLFNEQKQYNEAKRSLESAREIYAGENYRDKLLERLINEGLKRKTFFETIAKTDERGLRDARKQAEEEIAELIKSRIAISKKVESKKQEEEKAEINFTETEVQTSGKGSFTKEYPWILLENILLQERLHWLWGFIYLSSWTCNKILEQPPNKQFGNYISKEGKKIKDIGFDIQHKRGGKEWSIVYKTTKTKIKCNLLEARDNYETALVEFEGGKIVEAIEKLKMAISLPSYPNVRFIDAYDLLIRCIFRTNYKDISEQLLGKVSDFLTWYKRRLEESIFVIEKIYIQNSLIDEEEIKDEMNRIKEEKEKIERYYQSIGDKVFVPEGDKEFEQIVSLIQELRKLAEEEQLRVQELMEKVCHLPELTALVENKHIIEVFKLADGVLKKECPHLNWEGRLEHLKYHLFITLTGIGDIDIAHMDEETEKRKKGKQKFFFIGGIDLEKYKTIGAIKNYLLEELKKRIKASKLEEWREIPTDPSKIKVKESQGQVKTRYYE